MRTSSSTASSPAAFGLMRGGLAMSLWLTPMLAHAEEQDLGEAVHAIFIVGIFAMLFIVGLSFGIWMLVVRLRDKNATAAGQSGANRPNLESIWFPTATAVTAPPSQQPPETT